MAVVRRATDKDETWARAWTADVFADLATITDAGHGDVAFVTATGFWYTWRDDNTWEVAGSGIVSSIINQQGVPGIDAEEPEFPYIIPGPKGEDGSIGIDGSIGKDGVPGIDGIDGEDGFPGPQGLVGPIGNPGSAGQQGSNGILSIDGVDGEDGIIQLVKLLSIVLGNIVVQVKTSGSGTYTPSTNMKAVLVICIGGGGGNPGSTTADIAFSGGGGGGCAIKLFTAAEIGTSQPYAVGAVSTTTGNNSGLGTANALLQATGGGAGVITAASNNAFSRGGIGGVGTLGDLNINGEGGSHGHTISATVGIGGNGGNSVLGGGGRGGGSNTSFLQGEAGGAYGGGAGGGVNNDGTDLTAVNGAAGVIYFIEFISNE